MLEHYIWNGREKLRCGYTTGSCATLAAKAGAIMLLGGREITEVDIVTPKGIHVSVGLMETRLDRDRVRCAVKKDGGDDKDVTNGMLIFATVIKTDVPGEVIIDGGSGIGRVTKKGLDQEVGKAAINSVPRMMIKNALLEIMDEYDYSGGLKVIIEAEGGEEASKKTFNPDLGIVGGISIIGTSGIVEPMSIKALIDSVELEVKVIQATGEKRFIAVPGNYGVKFVRETLNINHISLVKSSNFIGDTIDFAGRYGFEELIIMGHMGKMVKLAGGMMNTHSMYGDCRREIFAAHAGIMGANTGIIGEIMESATSEGCIEILKRDEGLFEKTVKSISDSAQKNLDKRAGEDLSVGLITFTNEQGLIYISDGAKKILEKWGISI